jgi:hypothetical protein
MGIVPSALHVRVGQSVAIKVLTMSSVGERRRDGMGRGGRLRT